MVKRVAANYFTTSNRTVGFFIPTKKAERTPVPAVPDIAKLVDGYAGRQIKAIAKEASDVAPLAIEARVQRPKSIGGMKLALLPKKTRNESVHLRLTLHFGDAENLRGLSEAAGFLPELMTRGTKDLNRQQIQDLLDRNFVRLGTGLGGMRGMRGLVGSLGLGQATFTIETQREHLAAGLNILRQVLREPSLPYREFEVMKNEQITAIEQGRSDPMRLGLIRFDGSCPRIPATTSATFRLSTSRSSVSRRRHPTRLPASTVTTSARTAARSSSSEISSLPKFSRFR